MRSSAFLLLCAAGLASSCADDVGESSADVTEIKPNDRDVLTTDLAIDLASHTGKATITVAPATRRNATFEIGDLKIGRVVDESGKAIAHKVRAGKLHVDLAAKKPSRFSIEYTFSDQTKLEGASSKGTTFLWPHFCGNLFPCNSEPGDGVRLTLDLTGAPAGQTAIFPREIPADAPAYMLAWAIGDYEKKALGKTKAGTSVSVYYLPGEKQAAEAGTAHLTKVFDWLETTYGGYLFGDDVASVSADWGDGAFGGMEHHPYWHVSTGSMSDEETHAHEAAHGWFGDGVRIACWEDLTLSEGTVSYLTARALEATAGKAAGDAVWESYQAELDEVVRTEDRLAWPKNACNTVDVLGDLWNNVVYMKGAFFYKAVEDAVGREAIDRTIARFYAEHKGQAAGMQDMLDTIEDETGFDATPLAEAWLRSMGTPQ